MRRNYLINTLISLGVSFEDNVTMKELETTFGIFMKASKVLLERSYLPTNKVVHKLMLMSLDNKQYSNGVIFNSLKNTNITFSYISDKTLLALLARFGRVSLFPELPHMSKITETVFLSETIDENNMLISNLPELEINGNYLFNSIGLFKLEFS